MKPSQRWALRAILLNAVIACSPQAPAQPEPKQPVVSNADVTPAAEAMAQPPPPAVNEKVDPPGYAGAWALADGDCGNHAKTFQLSGETIDLPPGGDHCTVKSLSEEHPTGRSMNYIIKAKCVRGADPTEDTIALRFGASDTVMQMQLNDREPTRLVRCPAG